MNFLKKSEELKEKRIVFLDLDSTIINTVSGKTFPVDVTDFHIDKTFLDVLRGLGKVEYVFIVSNQGGIPEYLPKAEFEAKFAAIQAFMRIYLNIGKDSKVKVSGLYCTAKSFSAKNRKPNTGMLERCLRSVTDKDLATDKSAMVMVGDASGIHNESRDDFSDSDYRTARNFGIDYMDVEDFRNCR